MVAGRPGAKPALEDLILPRFREFEEYKPIVPLEVLAEQAGVPLDQVIKLDGNENPYGCATSVREALANYQHYHIYPDPEQREVRPLIASYAGIGVEHILMGGCGSDELIDLLMRVFLAPGDKVIDCGPTFGMYHFSAQVSGATVTDVPRLADFAIDVPGVMRAIDNQTKLVFLASPNNPSGNTTATADILALLDTGLVIVVDEAYFEFSGKTAASLVPAHENLVVLRTFSKWAGLAGLRVGYGIVPLPVIRHLWKIKQPYNVNAAALVAIKETFASLPEVRKTIRAIVEERDRLFAALKGTGFVLPWPSEANFLLCSVIKGQAIDLAQSLARRGIFVRYFDKPRLRDSIRISVGTPDQTDRLIEAMREIGEQIAN